MEEDLAAPRPVFTFQLGLQDFEPRPEAHGISVLFGLLCPIRSPHDQNEATCDSIVTCFDLNGLSITLEEPDHFRVYRHQTEDTPVPNFSR
jgi:hypothetical protein